MGVCNSQKTVKKDDYMYHFFVDNNNISDKEIIITGSDVNHIKNVLRLRENDKILISDGQGSDFYCIISEINNEEIVTTIESRLEESNELPSKIYLFQGLPKNDKMELIIQKAVELGAYEIIPVAMKNCVVKLDSKKETSKLKRWEAIAESAAKQSKRCIIPSIHNVLNFKQAIEYASELDINIVPYENQKGIDETRRVVDSIEPGQSIGIFIGPEGGFDEKEIEYAISQSFIPLTLGRRILRTETAGLAMLSILMYNLDR